MNKQINNKEKFVLYDAKGEILGRIATRIAKDLSGKNEVNYDPRIGGDTRVVVINSSKVRLSGEKDKKKIYWRHSGFPGGIYARSFEEMKEKDSREIIHKAVKGMMPKNKISKEAMKRLRVFESEEHPYKDKFSA
ncbi:MAG: 50S ribosomal protein L13 [Candidatus Moranbacteria bacterium]|nr:50S ribosomal protein L13 [Candidatus Moranbacteria bacterium]